MERGLKNHRPGNRAQRGARGLWLLPGRAADDALAQVLALKNLQGDGTPAFIAVPSRSQAAELTLALAQAEGPLVGPPRVGTIVDIAYALSEDGARPSETVARQLAAAAALNDVSLHSESLVGRMRLSPEVLARFIEEMEDSGLSEDQLLSALGRWEAAGSGPAARQLAGELRLLYRSYLGICRTRGLFSPGLLLRRAAERLVEAAAGAGDRGAGDEGTRTALPARPSWTRPVACMGFLTFTPLQRKFLSALARYCAVAVFLPPALGSPDSAGKVEAEEWRRHGPVRELTPPTGQAQAAAPTPPATTAAAAGAEEAGAPPADTQGRPEIRLLVSAGRRGELETVLAEVVDLVRQGYQPAQILLVARKTAPWRRLAQQVFSASGVPLEVEGAVSLADTGLGHTLLTVLEGLQQDRLEPVIGYLAGCYSAAEPAALQGQDLAGWRKLQSWPEAPGGWETLARLFPEDTRMLRACLSADRPGGARLHGPALVGLGRAMFAASHRPAGPDLLQSALDARALSAVERALQELAGWEETSAAHPTPEQCLEILARAPLHPAPRPGAVLLTSAERVTGRAYRAVFVLGLVDQEFPEAEGNSGLLSDALRADCNRSAGAEVFRERKQDREGLLFEWALSRAREIAYLSQRISEEDGGPLSPSPFLLALLEKPGGTKAWRARSLADVVHSPALAPSWREYLRGCAGTGAWPADPSDISTLARLEVRTRPPALSQRSVLQHLAARQTFSAGEIERYARCPLVWFLEHQVGVETPAEGPGIKELGLLLHRLLADLYREMSAQGLLPLGPGSREAALDLAERLVSSAEAREEYRYPPGARALLFAQVRFRLRDHIEREARWATSLRTEAVELSLPDEGVDIGVGGGVSGRVDRVDALPSGEGFAVIDYKSGTFLPGKGWAQEGMLQVPLYLLALSELWPERFLVGGGYLALGSGKALGFFADATKELAGEKAPWKYIEQGELLTELGACRIQAAGAVAGMRKGRLSRSDGYECPPYCGLGPACRSRHRSWNGR